MEQLNGLEVSRTSRKVHIRCMCRAHRSTTFLLDLPTNTAIIAEVGKASRPLRKHDLVRIVEQYLLMIFCRGNSTVAKTLLATSTPSLSVAQKFAALPQNTKLAIYGGGGAAAAILASALLFTCIRQRRAGRRERDAYNAKVEKEREDAYKDQMDLREKGLGGWDEGSYASQGEDALGGWGGTHVVPQDRKDIPPVPKFPGNVAVNEVPSRINSPAVPRVNSPAPRLQSPQLVSPQPQSPRAWNGGNVGGMIHNAGNAYSGGYGGSTTVPRSPGFPLSPQVPQQRGYLGGYASGGYQRF